MNSDDDDEYSCLSVRTSNSQLKACIADQAIPIHATFAELSWNIVPFQLATSTASKSFMIHTELFFAVFAFLLTIQYKDFWCHYYFRVIPVQHI